MSHFVYKQLPAKGIGQRDPQRPYVTGGLGDGIPVFVGDAVTDRTYDGDRILQALLREGEAVRTYTVVGRTGATTRTFARVSRGGSADRTYEGDRTMASDDRDYSGDRTYEEEDRDGP